MTTTYTGKDIKLLSDRDYVRQRTPVYLGNTNFETRTYPLMYGKTLIESEFNFVPAALTAITEIIDNTLDEFHHINIPHKILTIESDHETGSYTISDNGRGIPIDKHETGKYTPEVALGSLKAGRNFQADKKKGVKGQNGVGAVCVNYCSTKFEVTINRDGKQYRQTFSDGANVISAPTIKKRIGGTGTTVSFSLDPAVFKSVTVPEEVLRSKAVEIAMTNPGVTVNYGTTVYKFDGGLSDVVNNFFPQQKGEPQRVFKFVCKTDKVAGEFLVIPNSHKEATEKMYTWVNSSLLVGGGICNTQFCNALFDKIVEVCKKKIKQDGVPVPTTLLRNGLTLFCSIQVSDPDYDSQAKTRLTGPNIRKELDNMVSDMWTQFQAKMGYWIQHIADTAVQLHNKTANASAVEEFEKTPRSFRPIDGLLDANSRDRSKCSILITEGDSAKAQLCSVRDPATTAAFALTGKINNVYGATPAQLLKMGKITDLLACIGLVPSKPADRSKIRYGKIVIATDADYDGSDIFTLLVNLFFQFWPELFDPTKPPVIHRLVAPNVCAIKGKKRVHFTTRDEFEKVASKYTGYEIRYYKGLGSLAIADWEIVLTNAANGLLIPIVDDGNLASVLKLLFSDDVAARQEWLTHSE